MLDDSDAETFWLIAMFSNGWALGLTALVAVLVFLAVAMNHGECAVKTCPPGQKPQLMNNACLCATEAR